MSSTDQIQMHELLQYDFQIFAKLRPANLSARIAYEASVKLAVDDPTRFGYVNRFVHPDSGYDAAGGDMEGEGDASDTGYFKFSLSVLPKNPTDGWYLGTGQETSDYAQIDVLLGPPTAELKRLGLKGKHARLFFHKDSCRIIIEAKATVTIGKDGATTIRDSEHHVLEHNEMIKVGHCLYVFEHTPFYVSPMFFTSISQFPRLMRRLHGDQWNHFGGLLPDNTEPSIVGNYYKYLIPTVEGTPETSTKGFTRQGEVVAIKKRQNRDQLSITAYMALMSRLEKQENIAQLLDWIPDHVSLALDAYCVYTPFVGRTIATVVAGKNYRVDHAAVLALLNDYLSGLSFVHERGIVHCNITSGSLAITNFNNPKGIIIDFDSAISTPIPPGFPRGSSHYQAPEIVESEEWTRGTRAAPPPPPPEHGIDVWALGLGILELFWGQRPFHWGLAAHDRAGAPDKVTPALHGVFHENLDQRYQASSEPEGKTILTCIMRMTTYNPTDRVTASELCGVVTKVRRDAGLGRGAIRELLPVPGGFGAIEQLVLVLRMASAADGLEFVEKIPVGRE